VIGARRGALSAQTQVLVDDELPDTRVAGSNDCKANDNSKGHQLERDLLELPETLGDSVAYIQSGSISNVRR